MKLVKINNCFFDDCIKAGVTDEIMQNKGGRPGVLVLKLKYKGNKRNFIVPLRSNISPSTPTNQYFTLPPNTTTKPEYHHGIHYIKLLPIENKYISKYNCENPYYDNLLKIIDCNAKTIVKACQDYLINCESGHKHYMTPDIDGIITKVLDV